MVNPEGTPLVILRKKNDTEFKEISLQEYGNLPSDIQERECDIKYDSFSGLTNSRPLLTKTKKCKGCCDDYDHTIAFHSRNYCELDISDKDSSFYFNTNIPICKITSTPRQCRTITKPTQFKEPTGTPEEIEEGMAFIEKGKSLCREARCLKEGERILDKLLVKPDETSEKKYEMAIEFFRKAKSLLKKEWTVKNRTLNLAGDIICGVLHPRNKNVFQFWFIASEQFYRFFNLIMHEDCGDKKYILSGNNRLCTNTYTKKMMEIDFLKTEIEKKKIEQSQTSLWAEMMEIDDILDKLNEKLEELDPPEYWCLRSEKISQQFCHIYPAMALICLFNERLTSQNVPGRLPKWIVPDWLF
jgi:hypothetical protein